MAFIPEGTDFVQMAALGFRSVELAKDLPDEERDSALREKYQRLRSFFDHSLASFGLPQQERKNDYFYAAVKCVLQSNRTMMLMRAVVRSIEHAMRGNNKKEITLIEAGCGAGLLACFAAVLRNKIKVIGFDIGKEEVFFSRYLAQRAGLPNVTIEERDLLKNPYTGSGDIVIAEHLSWGMAQEHSTKIPRSIINASPDAFIPYGVRPVVVTGPGIYNNLDIIRCEKNPYFSFESGNYFIFPGEIVALGAQRDTDMFSVEANLNIPPGVVPLFTSADVQWLSPFINPHPSFTTTTEDWIRAFIANNLEKQIESLVAPKPLEYSYKERIYYGLHNTQDSTQRVQVSVKYPFGYQRRGHCRNKEIDLGNVSIITDTDRVVPCKFKLEGVGLDTRMVIEG